MGFNLDIDAEAFLNELEWQVDMLLDKEDISFQRRGTKRDLLLQRCAAILVDLLTKELAYEKSE